MSDISGGNTSNPGVKYNNLHQWFASRPAGAKNTETSLNELRNSAVYKSKNEGQRFTSQSGPNRINRRDMRGPQHSYA